MRPADPRSLVGTSSAPSTVSWTVDDTILYAIAVGAGRDPRRSELDLTVEDSSAGALRALPSMAAALCLRTPSLLRSLPLGDHPVVHAHQAVELDGPVPPAGVAVLESSVTAVHDTGRGAIVVTTTTATTPGGDRLFVATSQAYVIGAGGFGGAPPPRAERAERAPDQEVEMPTWPEQALLYRLTGDRNLLHADPVAARASGFPGPILHGLATLGTATRLLVHELAEGDPRLVRGLGGRFSGTVTPGDRLRLRIWRNAAGAEFEVLGPDGSPLLKEGDVRLVGHSV